MRGNSQILEGTHWGCSRKMACTAARSSTTGAAAAAAAAPSSTQQQHAAAPNSSSSQQPEELGNTFNVGAVQSHPPYLLHCAV